MPIPLLNPNNEMELVPEADVASAIASRQYAAPGGAEQPIPIRLKDGSYGTVPVSKLSESVNQYGAKVANPDEYQAEVDRISRQKETEATEEKHDTALSKATAVAAGAVDTGSLGLAHPSSFISQFVPPEDQASTEKYIEESQQVHPNYETAGQVLGVAAPIGADVLTAGAATPELAAAGLGGRLARAGGQILKTGGLAAPSIALRGAGAIGEGASEYLLKKALGGVAENAAERLVEKGVIATSRAASEGALVGMASETGHELQEDKGLTADKILAAGAHNALLGGALGLGGFAVGEGMGALKRGPGSWASSRLDNKSDAFLRKLSKGDPLLNDLSPEEFSDVRKALVNRVGITPLDSLQEIADKAQTKISENQTKFSDTLQKFGGMGDLIDNPKASKWIKDIYKIGDKVKLSGEPLLEYTQYINKALEDAGIKFEGPVVRDLDALRELQGDPKFKAANQEAFRTWELTGNPPKSLLEVSPEVDPQVTFDQLAHFGNSLASKEVSPEILKAINQTRAIVQDNITDIAETQLGRLRTGSAKFGIDFDKVQPDAGKYVESLRDNAKLADELAKASNLIENASNRRIEVGAKKFLENKSDIGFLGGAGIAAAMGHIPGAIGIGGLGLAVKAARAGMNYLKTGEGILTGSMVAGKLANLTRLEAVSSHIDSVTDKIVRATVLGTAQVEKYEHEHPVDHPETYDERAALVVQRASNPEETIQIHQDHLGWVGASDPKLAAQVESKSLKTVDFLAHQLPTTPQQNPNSLTPNATRKFEPTDQAKDHFNQCYEAANEPLKVLAKLQDGRMSRTEIMAFKATHPDMYTSCVKKFKDELEKAKEPLSLNQEANLKQFLDMPQESLSLETALAPAPNGQGPAPAMGAKGKGGGGQTKKGPATSTIEGMGRGSGLGGKGAWLRGSKP